MNIFVHKTCFITVLFLTVITGSSIVFAHSMDADIVQVDVKQNSELQYTISWSAANYGIKVVFPSECENKNPQSQNYYEQIKLCKKNIYGKSIRFEGLDTASKQLLVRYIPKNITDRHKIKIFMLNWQNSSFKIDKKQSFIDIAKTYFIFGVKHIFTGLDHLLFVLALLLIISDIKHLIATITAFTLAHTITLGLASFNIITVPRAPVEAVIALSIIFLAVEYIKQQRGREGWTIKKPWLISFAVGLLHGLGFADALTSLGLPQTDLPLALLTFNGGVEAGQLLFILTAVLITNMIAVLFKNSTKNTKRRFKYSVAYIIGSSAGLWCVERTWLLF